MEDPATTTNDRTAGASLPDPRTLTLAIDPLPSEPERRAIVEALRRNQLARQAHDGAWARRARTDVAELQGPA